MREKGRKDRTKSDDSWGVETRHSPGSFPLSPPFSLDLGGVPPQAARRGVPSSDVNLDEFH